MGRKKKAPIANTSNKQVFQVVFRLSDYPSIEAALLVSGLIPREDVDRLGYAEYDYALRMSERAAFQYVLGISDRNGHAYEARVKKYGLDSVIQLYKSKPREAQWIPLFSKILGIEDEEEETNG